MSDLDTLTKRETATEPPKRWKNWYTCKRAFYALGTGEFCSPPGWWGNKTFPSKELAEQFGIDWENRQTLAQKEFYGAVYVKSVPDPHGPHGGAS